SVCTRASRSASVCSCVYAWVFIRIRFLTGVQTCALPYLSPARVTGGTGGRLPLRPRMAPQGRAGAPGDHLSGDGAADQRTAVVRSEERRVGKSVEPGGG